MSFAWKIQNSRDQWKKKATERANSDRENRKAIKRKNRLIASQKRRIRDLENENAELKKRAIQPAVKDKTHMIFISLLLFTEARIGFRAVARVLSALKGVLGIVKAPCGQTVINWVIKLSLVRTSMPLPRSFCSGDRFSNGWVFMIDESIGHSGGKILAILAVRSDHYASGSGHPGLGDVRCAGLAVSDSWTGESVSAFLRKVIAVAGRPVAYVKDGGGNLKKACSLLEADGLGSPTLSDISHVSANLLKSAYGEHPDLEGFLSSCGNAASRLKQTVLTCLAPPKIRMKSRFMNLHRLVGWAEDVLSLSPKGRAPKNSILQKLRSGLDSLSRYRRFINNFLRDARSLLECQAILKNEGLNRTSREKCLEAVSVIPASSPVRIGMLSWLEEHMETARKLGLDKNGLLVSSDCIESAFGVCKSHGTGELKDPNRMALRLPSLCGKLDMEEAQKVRMTPTARLRDIQKELPSIFADRRGIFNGEKSLQDLNQDFKNLELYPKPRSEKREKNVIIDIISDDCEKSFGPKNESSMTFQKSLEDVNSS